MMEKRSNGALWCHLAVMTTTALFFLVAASATTSLELQTNGSDRDIKENKEIPVTSYADHADADYSDMDKDTDDDDVQLEEPLLASYQNEDGEPDVDDAEVYNENDGESEVENDSDEQGQRAEDDNVVKYSPEDLAAGVGLFIQKRNLGALARKGDMAARRIHSANSDTSPLRHQRDYDDDHVVHENWPQLMLLSNKRHIGSFQRGGGAHPKSSGKRNLDLDDDQDTDGMMAVIVKRNIAALARQGTLTNLRYQRRPTPWMSDDEYGMSSDDIDDGARVDVVQSKNTDHDRHDDGYKRNIHAFSRVTTPGSGFRSWLRERLHASPSTMTMKDAKRRNNYSHFRLIGSGGGGGGGRSIGSTTSSSGRGTGRRPGSRDRFRGIRSTRHRYLVPIDADLDGPSGSMTSSTSSNFRAPMAFVSRHHLWKRSAGGDHHLAFLRGLRSTSDAGRRASGGAHLVEIM